jgi:hypothetical protein
VAGTAASRPDRRTYRNRSSAQRKSRRSSSGSRRDRRTRCILRPSRAKTRPSPATRALPPTARGEGGNAAASRRPGDPAQEDLQFGGPRRGPWTTGRGRIPGRPGRRIPRRAWRNPSATGARDNFRQRSCGSARGARGPGAHLGSGRDAIGGAGRPGARDEFDDGDGREQLLQVGVASGHVVDGGLASQGGVLPGEFATGAQQMAHLLVEAAFQVGHGLSRWRGLRRVRWGRRRIRTGPVRCR